MPSMPQLATLSAALLRGPWPSNKSMQASELWNDRPCVVYAIRRMG